MSTSFKILDGNGKICSRSRLVLLWAVVATIIGFSLMIALIVKNNQLPPRPRERPVIRWCTTKTAEQEKCEKFSQAMNASTNLHTILECDYTADDVQGCIDRLVDGRSHAITLDGGLIAKHRDSVKPIVAEDYGEGPANYWAVAVAKTSSHASVNLTLKGMENKKACHTGYEKTAGWYFPIGTLMAKGIISPSGDGCNPLSLAEDLFQSMCVPGAQSPDACGLCSESCEKCNDGDYCGYTGAFRCLVEEGDVAFIKHTTVLANTDGNNDASWAADLRSSEFQLLCLDGTRAPVSAYAECSLGRAPSHAVAISKDAPADVASRIQEFLEVAELHFGYGVSDGDGDDDDDFKLFDGVESDLLFKSSTKRLLPLTESCETDAFLGEEYLNALSFVDNCVEDDITIGDGECLLPQYREESYEDLRWCVTKAEEFTKCEAVKSAIDTQNIKTDLQLSCINATSAEECAKLISENDADIVSLDGGEIFRFSRRYNLQPVTAELYVTDDSVARGRTYYAVAVVHKNDSDPFNFTNLEDLKTCHTGYGKTAGWIMPIGTLAKQGQITFDAGTCDVVDKVAEYFNASCVPEIGDLDASGKLCSICKNQSSCSSNDGYAGYTGAFKCLVEGGGDVAFVKHTTVLDAGGDKSLYQLLCPDGTRASIDEYKSCNLAEVPAHALMTAPRNTVAYREKVWSLLDTLQNSDFNLFESLSYSGSDLLFKDSTKCIGKVDETCKWQDFLGEDFFDAAGEVQCVNNPPSHEYQECQVSPCS